MTRHEAMQKKSITLALSGNPNAGKTTVFNAVTGARQHIANYPGVTVEKKYGHINHRGYDIEIVDLPGIYSLTAYSLEEIVARDFLINERPDVVVDIVDASNLDRNLYLALQFKELGVPLIIALNMIDVASSRGIVIDQQGLSGLLQVPVVPTVARANTGLPELLDKVIETAQKDHTWQPKLISYGRDINQALEDITALFENNRFQAGNYDPKWLALKCLEGDEQILQLIKKDEKISRQIDPVCRKVSRHIMNTLEDEPEGIIADHRYGYIAGVTKKTVKRKIESRLNVSDRIDKVLTNRFLGPLIMMAILYGIYEFTFWASNTPVLWVESFFGWLKGMISILLPEGNLHSLIVSGVIDGVGGVLGFVPLIMFMFFAIAIMEDAGYMARVAYMLDRVLRWFGLHGNSVMALLISGGISGGCAVPGVLATRTLRDPKERIATLLVVPFMNCGAKLPLFGVLIAAFFAKNEARMLFIFTLLSWAFALFAAKIIRSTLLKGPKTPFVMELPPYRMPTIKGLIIHTWERTWQYIKKAGTIILGISVVLWAMMTFPGLTDQEVEHYEILRGEHKAAFLALADATGYLETEKDLEDLETLLKVFPDLNSGKVSTVVSIRTDRHFPLAEEINRRLQGSEKGHTPDPRLARLASSYLKYREDIARVDAQEQEAALMHTLAGKIGGALETITGPLGFDYRVNIALIGGFAAKEVIVSTLGTAYSLGEADPEQSASLSARLKENPRWNPLRAFVLILFTMLYVPCFVTLAMIKKESSWKWAGFSLIFNLITAYLVSLVVFQLGSALGLGV